MSPDSKDKRTEDQQKHKANTERTPPVSDQAQDLFEQKTRPTPPYQVSEAGGPLPEIDEGPRPAPVDDIQGALFEASRQGAPADVDFEQLPRPRLEPGENALPEDDIQAALQEASRQGLSTEVDFDRLPTPELTEGSSAQLPVEEQPAARPFPQKKISRPIKPVLSPAPAAMPLPLPESLKSKLLALPGEFWIILSLFAGFRLLTLLLLRPGGFIRDWSDFDTYFGIAGLSDYGLYPFLDFWLEWPPLVPWLTVGIYRLSLLLPPWPDDPRLWFILMLGGIFLLFEIGNFLLLYRLTGRLMEDTSLRLRALWFYAGLFPPLYAMLGFFDGVTLFFLLLSLELIWQDRRFSSAIVMGIGFAIKLIPAVMLPVILRRLWHQYHANRQEAGIEMGLYVVIFGLTILALLAPFLIAGPEWILASARSMAGRSSWETVWAVLDGYYGFGVVAGDRLNPHETNFAIHPGTLPGWFWPLLTLLFAGIYAFILTRSIDYSRPRNVMALGGLILSIFMLYTKGYSPQFLVYLLPFVILLFPNGRGIIYALILTGLNILEQPIYFVLLPQSSWLLIFIVAVRFILFILLAIEFARLLWPAAPWAVRTAWAQRRLPLILGSSAAAALLLLTPLLLRAYAANRRADSPAGTLAGFIAAIQQNPTDLTNCEAALNARQIYLSDQATYRELYPYLSGDFQLILTTGAPRPSDFPAVSALLPTSGPAWVLPTGPQAQILSEAVSRRGRSLATFNFGDLGTTSLHSFAPVSSSQACLPLGRFTPNVDLLAHTATVRSGRVEVTLYWRARTAQSQNLTVFAQILNQDGQQVAGHDSVPRNGAAPVTTWPVEAIQADAHTISLPANLPPGDYRLITGLYNDAGQRIRVIGPNGSAYPNQAVPLGSLQLP